ncbi:MarR family transcriptional regulator [Bifidobacterium sp.]|uniref:MarR family transcriptional regulator n=1 Tax=Bifidobacterium sp. TaxID=41200 RepID=UPI0039EC1F22
MDIEQYQELAALLETLGQSRADSMYHDWISAHVPTEIAPLVTELTHNDFRIIDSLGNAEMTIGDVAKELGFSQGGVSRRVNFMSDKGLVEKYHRGKNRKNVYLRLTEVGDLLRSFHRDLHDHIRTTTLERTGSFSNVEVETAIAFLKALL